VQWGSARDGGLWLLTRATLYKIKSGEIARRIPIQPAIGNVWSLRESPDGTLWVSSFVNGLFRFRPDGSMRRFSRSSGFMTDSLRTLFTDRDGNHWAGTNGNGLIRMKQRRFASFGELEGLPPVRATSLAAMRDGSFLVGTYGAGLFRLRGGRASQDSPKDGFVQAVLLDRAGRLWVGSYSKGLRIVDRGRDLPVPAELGDTTTIEALFEDSKGRVWVGGSDRAAVY
jgi:ligand-binding sensor domain-containing protein